MAESLGLIRRIDEYVLQVVCAQIQAWDQAGVPPIRVAVNVSARWFGHPSFVEGVNRTLQSRQVAAQRLVLELATKIEKLAWVSQLRKAFPATKTVPNSPQRQLREDLFSALQNLGYQPSQVKNTLDKR